jgi:hypothetical protein
MGRMWIWAILGVLAAFPAWSVEVDDVRLWRAPDHTRIVFDLSGPTEHKLIVLDKNICSMTAFKQIVGRGTRIHEEQNKFYFTIMDFKKATELFKDPEFDGEPVVIYQPGPEDDPVPPDPEPDDGDDGGEIEDSPGVYKVHVSGVDVKILARRVEYLGEDGQLITESYRDYSRKYILEEYTFLKRPVMVNGDRIFIGNAAKVVAEAKSTL